MDISCPNCGHEFDPWPTIHKKIAEEATADLKRELEAMTPEQREEHDRLEREAGF